MKAFLSKYWTYLPILFLAIFTTAVYKPFFSEGKLPIPADTIVGLYHPWRDSYADKYPSGIPFKNFQITDSVRQQYPWRELGINLLKNGQLPLWNPYSFAGAPLLANLQSALFYPLNFLYLLLNFSAAWGWQVVLQTLLGGLFMYFYLKNLNLKPEAITLGVISWVGSGFFVAWLEWNTVVHVVIWLPLILYFIDRMFSSSHRVLLALLLAISLASSFLAGYLQPFAYVFAVSLLYSLTRIIQTKKFKLIPMFLASYVLSLVLILPQLLPTIRVILLSARDIDQANWQRPDWFLPWQNLAQFLAPDYFGNPATLNYFGVWNYQEFVGYIGIVGLLFSLFAMAVRRDRKTLFFATLLFVSLIFTLPTPLAKLPFELQLPFLSTSQPSRLILLTDFSLAVLSALGLDWFLKKNFDRKIFVILAILTIGLGVLLLAAIKYHSVISLHNLFLPTIIIFFIFVLLFFLLVKSKFILPVVIGLLILTTFDLYRFAYKFEPFSLKSYLYPPVKLIDFLKEKTQANGARIAAIDDRILPPNFCVVYKLQCISGYDPLYLRRYGEFVIAMERDRPDISLPFGFNRIIVPKNYHSRLFNLLGVKYLLSLNPISSEGYSLVFQEGETKVYENKSAFPRVFFVDSVVVASSKNEAISALFNSDIDLQKTAVIEDPGSLFIAPGGVADVSIRSYNETNIDLHVQTDRPKLLVLSDVYYPSWSAFLDKRTVKIYNTDYIFRGVYIPTGSHDLKFSSQL